MDARGCGVSELDTHRCVTTEDTELAGKSPAELWELAAVSTECCAIILRRMAASAGAAS